MRQEIFVLPKYKSQVRDKPSDPVDLSKFVQAFESGARVVTSFPILWGADAVEQLVVLEFDGDGKNVFHDADFNQFQGHTGIKVERQR